uniref:Uncharacterized protein n=1 Tax=Methanococcus maripaludis (strain C6 / ATCC BAA-1332) TaxID=444158 RepID=A9A6G9_METM6
MFNYLKLLSECGINSEFISFEDLKIKRKGLNSFSSPKESQFKFKINDGNNTNIQANTVHLHININGRRKTPGEKKSKLFKKYLLENIFLKDQFETIKRDSEYKNEPDYKVILKEFKKEFYVKCNFRSYLYNGFYDWGRIDQLNEFKRFFKSSKIPTYFAFGLSGAPEDPENLYLVPGENVSSKMKIEELEKWEISSFNDVLRVILD